MSDLEPLDPTLRALVDRERGAYVDDPSVRDAMLRRLEVALVLAPLALGGTATAVGAAARAGAEMAPHAGASAAGGSATAATSGTALGVGWKGAALLGALAFGGGVAVGEGDHARRDTRGGVVDVSATPPATALAPRPDALPSPPEPPASAEAPAPRSAAPSAPASTREVPSPPGTSSPAAEGRAERQLVDTARAALAKGLPAEALEATSRHAARFPRGALAEERDAMVIQALVALGRLDEARGRASRFRAAYPQSIFRPIVERVVASPAH